MLKFFMITETKVISIELRRKTAHTYNSGTRYPSLYIISTNSQKNIEILRTTVKSCSLSISE